MEQGFTKEAGQLHKVLKTGEVRAAGFQSTVKKVNRKRKELLSKIKDPQWARPHHYHMTCIEHNLGHKQPHCMEVAEMIPGHLRLLAIGRAAVVHQKALQYSLERTKKDYDQAKERIFFVNRELGGVRKDIKEIEKLMDRLRKFSHLFPKSNRARSTPGGVAAAAGNRG